MESRITLMFIFSLCTTLPEGWGLSVVPRADLDDPPAGHRVRSKRCSCNNQLDSECHYFCHLDIIWVNTPSKTTVYGLGSPLSRRRRSIGRCFCASSVDTTCKSFCHHSSANPSIELLQPMHNKESADPGVLVSRKNLAKARASSMEKTNKRNEDQHPEDTGVRAFEQKMSLPPHELVGRITTLMRNVFLKDRAAAQEPTKHKTE
ncbi:hypothetical protein DNTS_034909 [Danionella cerebrum]|uniref:Endothelin-like toxin domain-containing protein n=1 Tax=Danionella cerebrum TaxID=2873325 RepID=A0A553QPW4_9TELE|nr:hypothetical protein DNTS_034909 [Danionella translucida]